MIIEKGGTIDDHYTWCIPAAFPNLAKPTNAKMGTRPLINPIQQGLTSVKRQEKFDAVPSYGIKYQVSQAQLSSLKATSPESGKLD